MNPSRSNILWKLTFALFITFLTMILATAAWAAPTLRPSEDETSVQLSSAFIDALIALQITPAALKPGSLEGDVASFPIRGAGIDVGNLPAGEIFHVGGLSLTDASGTTVELFNFIIDILDTASPFLSGLVTANGDLLDRVPLFNLDLSNAVVESNSDELVISNVVLILTEEAANALNAVFFPNQQTPVFPIMDFQIGVAEVTVELPDADNNDDNDEDDDDDDDDDDD